MNAAVSFHCSACGACCNSPPAMTLAELFHHERRFVGCLAIRRVASYRPSDRLPAGDVVHMLSAGEVDAVDALAARLLYTGRQRYSVATQAFDSPSLGRCSERMDDGRCGIHTDRKPVTCGTVPLDPMFPDSLQHVVLLNRHLGSGFLAADCITAGHRSGHSLLVEGGAIVDDAYSDRLAGQRNALAADKTDWGDAVFGMLKRELFDDVQAAARIPSDGFLSLSLVPVLAVVAARSSENRERCLSYMRCQLALIDTKIALALQRRQAADKPTTQELRGFRSAYRRLEAALSSIAVTA